MSARVGVINYPGSNCEYDVCHALNDLGAEAQVVWHGDKALGSLDAVVIPGGFAHGDYLRPGAIARFSPIMDDVVRFAASGGPVLGICNGFQVLTEAGLLPGALMRNEGLRFICATVTCEVVANGSSLTRSLEPGTPLRLPINHYHGNFVCDEGSLEEIEQNNQVLLRYRENPNGSVHAIAGVTNREGNVMGLMPHPERASDELLGSCDGNALLTGFLAAC